MAIIKNKEKFLSNIWDMVEYFDFHTHGEGDKFPNIYKGMFVKKGGMARLNELTETLYNEKDRNIALLSKKNIKDYLGEILLKIKRRELTKDEEICQYFEAQANLPADDFLMIRPIYGLEFTTSDVFKLGPFSLFPAGTIDSYLPTKYQWLVSEEHKDRYQENIRRYESYNLLAVTVRVKTLERARELGDYYFSMFDTIARFMLTDNEFYDVSVLGFNRYYTEELLVASNKGIHSTLSGSGTIRQLTFDYAEWSSDNFARLWELASKYYKGDACEWEKRILFAVHWTGHAVADKNDASAFTKYVFALETLLVNDSKGIITAGIAYQISELAAFILGENTESRKDIFKLTKDIYAKRSAIVHGGSTTAPDRLLQQAKRLIFSLIHKILSDEDLLALRTSQDLNDWLMSRKFA